MATLETLKHAFRLEATAAGSLLNTPLSETQYSDGFDTQVQGSRRMTYDDSMIPQLSHLLAHLVDPRGSISALEIGPGLNGVLGYLIERPTMKVKKYTGFEPNSVLATKLENCLSSTESPLPCPEGRSTIRPWLFALHGKTVNASPSTYGSNEKFDIFLFCYSVYGMKPEAEIIQEVLGMLVEQPEGGMVVVL